MASPKLVIEHGDHKAVLTDFAGDGIPRSFADAAQISYGATGAVVQGGSSRAARRLWTVVAYCPFDVAYELEDLYVSWDTERASGKNAVVYVTDTTFLRPGVSAIQAYTLFSDAVRVSPIKAGVALALVSFGLSEV